MGTDKLVASAQYNDWKGSVAADRADKKCAENWLQENGYMEESEFLLGMKMYAGESHGAHKDPISVDFIFAIMDEHDNVQSMINDSKGEEVKVRNVSVQVSLAEFFGLFKRFSIALSPHGMFDGNDYYFDE